MNERGDAISTSIQVVGLSISSTYRSHGTKSIGLISARMVLARFEQLVKGMKLHAQGLLR